MTNVIANLVGEANESSIVVGGVSSKCLVDTGSMVTTISDTFYQNHLQSNHPIMPLDNLLSVEVGDGNLLQYLGYIEVDIDLPIGNNGELLQQSTLALIVPDTSYNRSVPICIGTNIINIGHEFCKQNYGTRYMQTVSFPTAWSLAFQHCKEHIATDYNPILVSTTKSVSIEPDSQVVIHALCRVPGVYKSDMLVETCIDVPTPSGVVPIPGLINVDGGTSTSRVNIRLCNLTAKKITIPSRMVVAELHSAQQVHPTHLFDHDESSDDIASQNQDLVFDLTTTCLSESQKDEVHEFLKKWRKVFSFGSDPVGHTSEIKHTIKLDNETPFKERTRRIPPGMFDEVREHLNQLLESGIIRNSSSPWSSNVVCARKRDGSLRLCTDFRKLNSRTVKDSYALPRIEDTLDSLSGAKIFSSLDLRSGYYQVEIDENDKSKTAFSVDRLGFFEHNRMAFGLTNAPATFQRLVERCLQDLTMNECCLYLDDIVVFSSSVEEHIERLERVFQRLHDFGLTLNPSKCCFLKQSVKYLGHIISENGMQTDPDKIAPLHTWPVPTTVKELRQFLGFSGYYRRFIKNYSKIAKPLTSLLQGNCTRDKQGRFATIPIIWNKDAQSGFEKLKEVLSCPPVLAYADYSLPFVVNTDASLDGLGAILYQTQNGQQRPIAFASRGLKPAERIIRRIN